MRKHCDFTGKVVFDYGCNVGAMLHHLPEIKRGIGVDYDYRCVMAAINISQILERDNLVFYRHDFDKDINQLYKVIGKGGVDVALVLSLGSWVKKWRDLYTFAFLNSRVMFMETNNDNEGAEQINFLCNKLGAEITLISDASKDDTTGNYSRKLYLIK
jgi:hypothetical protein